MNILFCVVVVGFLLAILSQLQSSISDENVTHNCKRLDAVEQSSGSWIQAVHAKPHVRSARLRKIRKKLSLPSSLAGKQRSNISPRKIQRGMTESELMRIQYRRNKTLVKESDANILRLDKKTLARHRSDMELQWLGTKGIPAKVTKPGVDMVYVVNLDSCPHRWEAVQIWAYAKGISVKRWNALSYRDIQFDYPPLPVINLELSFNLNAATKGRIGCTMTHLQIWRDAWENRYKRILVLEDDVVLTDKLLRDLPQDLDDLDQLAKQASAKGKGHVPPHYHFLYLRRYALSPVLIERTFGKVSSGRSVTYPVPSWGTAAYILTLQGIEWLLSHVTYYSLPLDVQISEFQKFRPDFVALCLCNKWLSFRNQCPENTITFSEAMRGNCTFSASQAGGRRKLSDFPNMWRYHEALYNGSFFPD